MKVKGINPIEQHIEKIILGVVAIVLLAVLAMQFLTQPNAVDVGGRSVPPQNVYVELERQAESLDSQLRDDNPALPDVQPTNLVERYDRAFARTDDTPVRLSAALGAPAPISAVTGTDISAAGPSSDIVAVPTIPRTAPPVAASQWGALDPYALDAVPAYSAFVPQQQPFDLASVTIEASFSGSELRQALVPAEGGAGVPRRFWQGTGIAVLAFEVERQQLGPDGSWSNPEPITTPPGTPVPTRALAPDAGLPELTELVSKAAAAAPDVQRPMAPPTIAGPEWAPPSERVVESTAGLSRADRIIRSLERAVAELERIQNAPQTFTRDDRGTPGSPGGRRTPTTRPTRPTPTTTPGPQSRIQQLTRQIEDYRQQLQDLGVTDPTTTTTTGRGGFNPNDPRGAQSGQSNAPAEDLLTQDSLQLWAHDLGVQPGETYRYRTRVAINNPLFRKGPLLDADNRALQAASRDPFARGGWSEWSDPVVVGAREYYFVTGADSEGSISGGRAGATIEVFSMYYGHYRRASLPLVPGDLIEASIRIPSGLYTIQTGIIDAAAAAEAILAATNPTNPANPTNPTNPTNPNNPGNLAPPATALPPGLTLATGRLTIDLGAYVLDVAARPIPVTDDLGRTQIISEVILRGSDGSVVVRTSREDTQGPAYALASESASSASDTPLRAPGQPPVSPSAGLFDPPSQP